jgi:hypothetical protein
MPKPKFIKLGMYVMAPEPISMTYFINSTCQSVCLYMYPLLVVRQMLGNLFSEPLSNSEYNNRLIVRRIIFYEVPVVSEGSLYVCVSPYRC